MKQLFWVSGSILISLFLFCKCSSGTDPSPTNNPPLISSLTAIPDTIFWGNISTLTCTALDPDDDKLIYIWKSVAGTINGMGASINWIAPDNIGNYKITCEVKDGKGGIDSSIINIEVVNSIQTDRIVDAKANIFGAGKINPPAPAGGEAGILPTEFEFTEGINLIITFPNVSGSVSCCGSNFAFAGPDGYANGGYTYITSYEGISGINHDTRNLFLVGVFVDDFEPMDPAPLVLSFNGGGNFLEITPVLNQTFFIGDGLTETGSGQIQKFLVPQNATRLFLGFADAEFFSGPPGLYGDNLGELVVNILLKKE